MLYSEYFASKESHEMKNSPSAVNEPTEMLEFLFYDYDYDSKCEHKFMVSCDGIYVLYPFSSQYWETDIANLKEDLAKKDCSSLTIKQLKDLSLRLNQPWYDEFVQKFQRLPQGLKSFIMNKRVNIYKLVVLGDQNEIMTAMFRAEMEKCEFNRWAVLLQQEKLPLNYALMQKISVRLKDNEAFLDLVDKYIHEKKESILKDPSLLKIFSKFNTRLAKANKKQNSPVGQ